MSPRKSQQGASASVRKVPAKRRAGSAVSSRNSDSRAGSASKKSTSTRPSRSERSRRDASWFRWWLLPPIVIVAVAVFIATYYPVARVQYAETRKRAALQAQLDSLNKRNAHLATEVARLKTPEGVEDYARSQLGMVKRGERVVVVTGGAAGESATMTIGASPQIDESELTTTAPSGPWTAFLDSVFEIK